MMRSITISDVATYTEEQRIDGLTKVNFIFGANATGKSTIGKIIADPEKFPSCSIEWQGATRLKAMVFNRDFVKRHFEDSPEIPGIFTLGSDDIERKNKIRDAKAKLGQLEEDKTSLTNKLNGTHESAGRIQELEKHKEESVEKFWERASGLREKFREALKGTLNSKSAFKRRLLDEQQNPSPLITLEQLQQEAQSVFDSPRDEKELISEVMGGSIFHHERNEIMGKTIVGKGNSPIAQMIEMLENSDWVKSGKAYHARSHGRCPFCQQETPQDFANALEEYFDEAFKNDIEMIHDLKLNYQSVTQKFLQDCDRACEPVQEMLESTGFSDNLDLLKNRIHQNLQQIEQKMNAPSNSLMLQSSRPIVTKIQQLIKNANEKIEAHNYTLQNIEDKKKNLISQVWRHIVNELSADLATYQIKKTQLQNAIQTTREDIKSADKEIAEATSELATLERGTTSIQPTITSINKILSQWDFHDFTIQPSEDGNSYRLLRQDRSAAQNTLSEGERGFITFLYFYHFLQGGTSTGAITNDRIVVFDDPVSSLDSNVLFIVSTLIRKIFQDIRKNNGNIKQALVLTHNVYFHREVSYSQLRKSNQNKFWIINKRNGRSEVVPFDTNPVKTSYELLWDEFRRVANSDGHIPTMQNVVRRILESYFRFSGGFNYEELLDHFRDDEKIVCHSLISWLHAGSHSSPDDIFTQAYGTTIAVYLNVFKAIFEKTGQIGHYNMMMSSDGAKKSTPD